jgi:hypothetical protein
MLRGHDGRKILAPLIGPKSGARLGIKVEKGGYDTKGLGGNGEVR